MTDNNRIIIFTGLFSYLISIRIVDASVVSPSHVNASADGKTRSLQLDQESAKNPKPFECTDREEDGKYKQGPSAIRAQKASTSPLESTLLVCKNASTKKAQPEGKPGPALPLPKSQVLGQVRDFLGVISEANERLKQDAKDNPENYDIEVLTGNESRVVNMELMLGVADLQTPEAVAAAESAIVGCQPVIPLVVNSSGEESEDSSDDDSSSDDSDDEDSSDDSSSNDNDDQDSDEIKDDTIDKEDKKTTSHARLKTRKSDKDNSLSEDAGNNRSQKRPKIVELS